jgi:uncharacterized protein DUF6531
MRTNVFPERFRALSLMLLGFCLLCGVSAYSQSTMSSESKCLSDIMLWLGDAQVDGPCEATGPGQGPFTYMCYYWNYQCTTGPASCPACGEPISLTNGDTYIVQQDLAIPGLGGGLRLVRTWNSVWPKNLASSGRFGGNWKSNFEERVYMAGSGGPLTYARGDGSFWRFQQNGTQWNITSPANESVSLTPGTSYWTIRFQDGESRRFSNETGSLLAIIDRNGNTTQIA